MNWLIYIFGGGLFISIIDALPYASNVDRLVVRLCAVMTWIGICWKFIH